MAIKIKIKSKKRVSIIDIENILQIAENELVMKTSPFFMNSSGLQRRKI
jgi:hypothetical protein